MSRDNGLYKNILSWNDNAWFYSLQETTRNILSEDVIPRSLYYPNVHEISKKNTHFLDH